MDAIRTVGHGTLEAAAFSGLVAAAGIRLVVDVRRFPGSRRHPHFGADAMAAWLADGGVVYRGIPALGGRRTPAARSPNIALRNPQFRAYADHMATEEFRTGLNELLGVAADSPCAVLCAESVWWRCHRRLLSDHLVLVHELPVAHLFHDGRLTAHHPSPEARRVGDHVVYDAGVPAPLFDR